MASSPVTGERPMMQGLRRSSTQPFRQPSLHEKAGLEKADANAEILYSHPSARVVRFSPPKESIKTKTTAEIPRDTDYPIDTVETLPWRARTEVPIASGALVLEKVRGSTNFLKCQEVTHAILRNSQCWCVDGESKFVLRVQKFEYYRIELPSTTEEDKRKVEELKTAFSTVLRYERTPCPFIRAFQVDLPDDAITPRRKGTWKRRDSSQLKTPESEDRPVRPSNSSRKWSMKSPPTAYPRNGPLSTELNVQNSTGAPTGVYQRSPLHRRQSELEDYDDGQSDAVDSRPESEPESDAELSDGSAIESPRGRLPSGKQPGSRSASVSARVAAFETVRVVSRAGSFRHSETTTAKPVAKIPLDRTESFVASTDSLILDTHGTSPGSLAVEQPTELPLATTNDSQDSFATSGHRDSDFTPEGNSHVATSVQGGGHEDSKTSDVSEAVRMPTETEAVEVTESLPPHEFDGEFPHQAQGPDAPPAGEHQSPKQILEAMREIEETESSIDLMPQTSTPLSNAAQETSLNGHTAYGEDLRPIDDARVVAQKNVWVDPEQSRSRDQTQHSDDAGTQSHDTDAKIDDDVQEDNLSTVSSTDSFHTMVSSVPRTRSNGSPGLTGFAQAGQAEHAYQAPDRHKRGTSVNTVVALTAEEVLDESDVATPLHQQSRQLHDGVDSFALDQALAKSVTETTEATDQGIRQRLSARRTFSPPPPASIIVHNGRSRQGASHDVVKAILQHAVTTPIEVVVLLIHVISRIAAGATVNDLLSGELFRRPEYRSRVSGFADRTDGSASHDTEDDYGVPIRGRAKRRRSSERVEFQSNTSQSRRVGQNDHSRSPASVD